MSFENEKYEFMLHVWGPMFDTPAIAAEGLKPGRHYFERIEELWYFFAELQIMRHKQKAGALLTEISEGKDVRYFTRATLLLLYNYKTYEVGFDFSQPIDEKKVEVLLSDAGVFGCDCFRSTLLRKFNPEEKFEVFDHGNTIELLKIKTEYIKRQEATL